MGQAGSKKQDNIICIYKNNSNALDICQQLANEEILLKYKLYYNVLYFVFSLIKLIIQFIGSSITYFIYFILCIYVFGIK